MRLPFVAAAARRGFSGVVPSVWLDHKCRRGHTVWAAYGPSLSFASSAIKMTGERA